ncbi:PHP domain-containing protein [Dactylosporangium matsuzakiense]|uniref:PHP domain-containing protein n=1 Tax=Dactylosporangium matsuzakiense TaxID=53360 RepID=A0A9W6KIP6_9ACTN|nr:PHP domain-containing protein [Dactylosporangium matsuzakiense]UWZ44529.1 PHP domain-containing protein [Dactylosporangium matsuzakiense]GLL01923.1 PHP domain-containing protein [Dactylosporangium matsuzakiense]
MPSARDPIADLRRIAFLLERAHEKTYRVRAFRGAAATLGKLAEGELATRAQAGTLTDIQGIGDVTARCVVESLNGEEPVYLRRLEATAGQDLDAETAGLLHRLRGDCHSHSDWSDGGSPIDEMAMAAAQIGHEYLVLTDHSPRLTVARGLSAERLEEQLGVVADVNAGFRQLGLSFRLLTGIEVDILADGSLDQTDELLDRLDVVVASVHSNLKDEPEVMTRRMVNALANPRMDILGHCTGRLITGGRGTRAESRFDAEAVFAAAVEHDKAIEINSRPERLDPPKRLLRVALEAGCRFTIDTDAHAPGQLDWLANGCARAVACGVPADRILNTLPADDLLAWAASHK